MTANEQPEQQAWEPDTSGLCITTGHRLRVAVARRDGTSLCEECFLRQANALEADNRRLRAEAEWFIEWIARANISPREAGMDVQAQKWLTRNDALQQPVAGEAE